MKKQELKQENEFLKECLVDITSEYTSDCKKLSKKIENLHISSRKKDEKIKRQSAEITLLLKQKEDLKRFVVMLEKQMHIQDNAIERKDMQYEALKKLYKDDLINGRL